VLSDLEENFAALQQLEITVLNDVSAYEKASSYDILIIDEPANLDPQFLLTLERKKCTTVFLITSAESSLLARFAAKRGAVILTKPVLPSELIGALTKAFEEFHSEQSD